MAAAARAARRNKLPLPLGSVPGPSFHRLPRRHCWELDWWLSSPTPVASPMPTFVSTTLGDISLLRRPRAGGEVERLSLPERVPGDPAMLTGDCVTKALPLRVCLCRSRVGMARRSSGCRHGLVCGQWAGCSALLSCGDTQPYSLRSLDGTQLGSFCEEKKQSGPGRPSQWAVVLGAPAEGAASLLPHAGRSSRNPCCPLRCWRGPTLWT